MVKIGLRAHDLGRHDSDKIIPFLKNIGYNSMQLVCHKALTDLENYDDPLLKKQIEDLKKTSSDYNFSIALLGCYQDFANPNVKEYVRSIFKRSIDYANALNVRFVATETSFNQDISHCEELYKKTLIENTVELCHYAQEKGVEILLEPVRCQPLNNVLLCKQLKEQCTNLKFIFDPCNIIKDTEIDKQDNLWSQWLSDKTFVENIAIIHLKDFIIDKDGKRQMVKLGDGLIDYQLLTKYFKSCKALEALIREWERAEWATADIAFMQNIAKAF